MQKFVSKYMAAAHLAILAVAPLFLSGFFSDSVVAVVVLWLTLFAAVWSFFGPSKLSAETSSDARHRVLRGVVRDPVFWVMTAVTVFCGLRAINVGVSAQYDTERGLWYLAKPFFEGFCGSAAGAGFLPFAAALASAVVAVGARHSLGKAGRFFFFVTWTSLSGVATFAIATSSASAEAGAFCCSLKEASYAGIAFGLAFIASPVAVIASLARGWRFGLFVSLIGCAGNGAGLFLYSPPYMALAFAIGFLLVWVMSIVDAKRELPGAAGFKCFLVVTTAIVVAVTALFCGLGSSLFERQAAAWGGFCLFPENFWQIRETLSAVSLKMWKDALWLGNGLGSFAPDLNFYMSLDDWAQVPYGTCAAPNGAWMLLVERGIVGAVALALPVVLSFVSWSKRLAYSFEELTLDPIPILAPIALLAVGSTVAFDASFMRPDALVALIALLSLSTSSFPVRHKLKTEKDNG